MSNPVFSIIVPVYNVEKYLSCCIDSILNQRFKDFELILIDDGSKDKSLEICEDYAKKDDRVKVIHKDNGGVSSARNMGLNAAQGEWLAFVDSDDYVSPEWLQYYANNLDADILFQGVVVENKQNQIVLSSNLENIKSKYADSIELICQLATDESGMLNGTWGKIVRRSLVENHHIRFDESCQLSEDLIFALDCLRFCDTLRTVAFNGYHYQMANSYLTTIRHKMPQLVAMKKKIFNAASFLLTTGGEKVYKTIAQREFLYVSYQLMATSNHRKDERIMGYDFLRELAEYVDISKLKNSRRIFGMLKLPNNLFDPIFICYSWIYRMSHSTIGSIRRK